MTQPFDTEVLIVGAGPTGLMAALLLVRSGVSVRILDKSATQAHESRALGVQSRTLEMFQNIGVIDEALAAGMPAHGVELFSDGKLFADMDFTSIDRPDAPFPFVLVLAQSETERILLAALQREGVSVERQFGVRTLVQDAESVEVSGVGPDGEFAIRARYAIGADGAHSVVRHQLGLSFEGAPYASTFLLADGTVVFPENFRHRRDRVQLFLHRRLLAALFPFPQAGRARVLAMDPHADTRHTETQGAIPATLPEVEEAFREATGLDVRIPDAQWVSRYRVHHRGVDRYRERRVFVAGDAAHIHSPAGGQGMNTGLQDAANLAWKLALVLRRGADDALLETYNRERRPVGDHVLKFTDAIFSAMTTQSDWLIGLRNALLPAVAGSLTRLQSVRARAFLLASELDIAYEAGPAIVEADSEQPSKQWADHVPVGHRAPNARVSREQDVFGLIAGYGFHVLALSSELPSSAEMLAARQAATNLPQVKLHILTYPTPDTLEEIVPVETPEAFHAYGLREDIDRALYLVRPDGYIAWRSVGWRWDDLVSFVRRWFLPAQALKPAQI